MTEETPSRMSFGYRILNNEAEHDQEMDLSPVPFEESHHNSTTKNATPMLLPLSENRRQRILFSSPSEEDENGYLRLSFAPPLRPTRSSLNYLNLIILLVHMVATIGVGIWGLDGLLPTQWEVMQQHETLVTPAPWVLLIWIPILISEGVFGVAQLLPTFCARSIIQDGVGYFFFYSCLLQTAWTILWAFRFVVLSYVFLVATLLALVCLLASQYFSQLRGGGGHYPYSSRRIHGRVEYGLFQFPFFLHCGWVAVLAVVQTSVLVRHVAGTEHLATSLSADIVALGLVLCIAGWVLVAGNDSSSTDFCIPCVVLWSLIGIAVRLHHPSPALLEDYGPIVIEAMQLASYTCAGVVALLLSPRLLVKLSHEFCTISVTAISLPDDSYTE